MKVRRIVAAALAFGMLATGAAQASMVAHFVFTNYVVPEHVVGFQDGQVSLEVSAFRQQVEPVVGDVEEGYVTGKPDEGLGVELNPAAGALGYGPINVNLYPDVRYTERLNLQFSSVEPVADSYVSYVIFSLFEPDDQVRIVTDNGLDIVIGYDDTTQFGDTAYVRKWTPDLGTGGFSNWLAFEGAKGINPLYRHSGVRIREVAIPAPGTALVMATGIVLLGWMRFRSDMAVRV